MGVLTFAGRIVLVVVNIVFVLVSVALVVGGFILRFATDLLDVQSILDTINTASSSLFSEEVDTTDFDLGATLGVLATVMIVLGLVLLAISFIGCCSACYNITTLMLVYAIILIVILLAQITVVILILAVPDQFKSIIKTQLLETVDEYEGLRGTSATSLGWNYASVKYKCCGVDSFKDFENKGSWKGNGDKADGTDVVTPIVCCKNLPTDPTETENCAGKDGVKDENAIAARSNKDKGCVDEVWTDVVENRTSMHVTVFAICVIAQIVLILFAILGFKDRGIKGGVI